MTIQCFPTPPYRFSLARRSTCALALAFFAAAALPVWPEAPKTEPSIKMLAGLIGNWAYEDASTTNSPGAYRDTGTRVCNYALQDQFIRCESTGKVGERERNYVFYFNYNKIDRRFEMIAMHGDYSRKTNYNVSVYDEGKRIELTTDFNPRDDAGSRSWATITFQSSSKMTWETRINRRGQSPDVWPMLFKDVATKQ